MRFFGAANVDELLDDARRIVIQTDTCTCADDPHQNALHDLAHDVVDMFGGTQ
ncbi:MAG TPA: hypothetical protein VK735_39985 [Pseudonocardia sp.]|uniref:hypothetical protein n=1 Tax=Pseudonocardia sp. TaxID=60912 RepID=UPI002B823A29|nr:hypothetical protein [Pseudonocardia sp.]HTF53665.1 hypothetical protein [Pseudonocardia sp.]